MHEVQCYPSEVTSQRTFAQFFLKGRNTPKNSSDLKENHAMRFRISESPTLEISSSSMQRRGVLNFLPEARSLMRVYCFFFFFCLLAFPRGDRIEPVILDDRERAHLIGHQEF